MTVLTFREELERKAIETADDLAHRHDVGVLSDREFRIAINAVWDTTSGLVDGMTEVMNAVATMDLKEVAVQIVMSNGKTAFIVGRNKLTVSVQNVLTLAESNIKVFDTEVDAAEHQRKLVGAFVSKGFTKL
jgi:hypothetical protein